MNEHVTDWLGAYHDGELRGARRFQVELHLNGCVACRAELESLVALSTLMKEAPIVPGRTPASQFVAQVRLRLRPRPVPVSGLAGWLLLSGLLSLWVVLQAVLIISRVALLALPFVNELLGVSLPPEAFIGQIAVQLFVLDAVFSAVVATLTWSWLAGWWAARPRQRESSIDINGYPVIRSQNGSH